MGSRWNSAVVYWLFVSSIGSATGSAISAAPIASIISDFPFIADTGIDSAPIAASLAAIANSFQNDILQVLESTATNVEKVLFPEAYYSYGSSPPVYPSPQGSGTGNWTKAYAQARSLVSRMTNEEKNNITTPALDTQGCNGFTGSVPRLGFPGICLNDAESGVRAANALVNGYPAQLSVGASWNKDLAFERAKYLGAEFKAKGVNVALGPVIGPLGRIAKGGRNWEGFSNDPYLAGSLVDPTVRGFQLSVIACVKHFIANEQETNRNPFLVGLLATIGINLNNSVSANVDDRTMHELYLWPFYDAVKAGAGSVMGSYNRVNNSYAVQNSKILNGLLKGELGFEGFVLSDWFAQHTGVASANAGLDMVMPLGIYWGNNQLATAVKNGSIKKTRLDDMATRILASWYRFAPFQTPSINANIDVDARTPAAAQNILQAAVEGHVLVKNTNSALPLKNKPKTLSLFGYDAISGLNTSASDTTLYPYSLTNTRKYTNGQPFGALDFDLFFAAAQPAGKSMPEVAFNGTMISGGGSGGVQPTSMVSAYDALQRQATLDGTTLHTDFISQNPAVRPSDACLVMINAQSSESADRSTLADTWSDTLVANVANKCKNTIVVIHNAGIRLVDRWIDHPNVTAVLFAHLPGQASGDALTEILYGRQSPSGRLPYTVAKQEADYGSLLNPTLPDAQNPQYSQSNFEEGVFIDYRHFIQKNITPRFAFGYGLTYSTFNYSKISIVRTSASRSLSPPDAGSKAPEGGLASLYDVIATVTIDVSNTGKVAAAEVAQLYVGIPNSEVPKTLRGFDKHLIQPGQSVVYTFPLRRRDLSVWDTTWQQWMLQAGTYRIYVGKSVLDIQLTGSLTM